MDFPSIDKLNQAYHSLIREDFTSASVAQVLRAIESALGRLPEVNIVLNGKVSLVRARKVNEDRCDVSNINTFGMPPRIETRLNRANLIGYPVFYASTNSDIAMQEIRASIGSEYYVSVWDKPPAVDMRISVLLLSAVENNELGGWIKAGIDRLEKELNVSKDILPRIMHSIRLRSRLFTESNYDITAKMAHNLLYFRASNSDAIVYPSVVNEQKNNFAVNSDFVNKYLIPQRCYKFKYIGKEPNKLLSRGLVIEEKIEWLKTGHFQLDAVDSSYGINT